MSAENFKELKDQMLMLKKNLIVKEFNWQISSNLNAVKRQFKKKIKKLLIDKVKKIQKDI